MKTTTEDIFGKTGGMPPVALDHVALPCFDVRASHTFYGETLGCPLIHAQRGPAEAWGKEE